MLSMILQFALLFMHVEVASSAPAVRTLSPSTFDAAVEKDGDLLVMFHAPWCEHCKELMPQFEGAAARLKEEKLNLQLAKVDAAKYEDLAKKQGVKGYPTLRYFKQGDPQVMDATNSGRTEDEIYDFAKKVVSSPNRIQKIDDEATMTSFLEAGGVCVVGFFESDEHAEFFTGVAEKFRFPVRFGWTTSATLASEKLGLDAAADVNTAVLLKPFDERRVTFTAEKPLDGTKKSREDMSTMMHKMMGVPLEEAQKLIPDSDEQKKLSAWVLKFMLPLVVPFQDSYMDLIFQGPVQAHFIAIADPKDDKTFQDTTKTLTELALERRGEVLHILMPSVEGTKEVRDYFGVGSHTVPTAVFSDMRHATEELPQGVQVPYPEGRPFELPELREFIKGGLANGPAKPPGKTAPKKKKKKRGAEAPSGPMSAEL